MGPTSDRTGRSAEVQVIVRKRNQVTLPSEAVDLLHVGEGDVIVMHVEDGYATMRPVRRSYAGIAKGVYGDDPDGFVANERSSWE
jgi:bifunctional DNA-binding transcriptional regulator/antitoxin component of YhaV-PrlF toxin-antitoxin module